MSILSHSGSLEAPTYIVRFKGIAQFILRYASNEILVSLLGDVTNNTIEHLLVDQIWPRLLAHSGHLVVHAAGVSGPNGAIVFVGQSGRGKSTLSASLHAGGFTLLGDDAMVMSVSPNEAHCRAVYRSLRLFPDSIATVFEHPVKKSKVAHYSDKHNIHLPVTGQDNADQRLQAIFLIGENAAQACPSVKTVSPADACMSMVEHSFWLDPTDVALAARKFTAASALANFVPTYQLDYPRDYAKIGELHAAIFSVLD